MGLMKEGMMGASTKLKEGCEMEKESHENGVVRKRTMENDGYTEIRDNATVVTPEKKAKKSHGNGPAHRLTLEEQVRCNWPEGSAMHAECVNRLNEEREREKHGALKEKAVPKSASCLLVPNEPCIEDYFPEHNPPPENLLPKDKRYLTQKQFGGAHLPGFLLNSDEITEFPPVVQQQEGVLPELRHKLVHQTEVCKGSTSISETRKTKPEMATVLNGWLQWNDMKSEDKSPQLISQSAMLCQGCKSLNPIAGMLKHYQCDKCDVLIPDYFRDDVGSAQFTGVYPSVSRMQGKCMEALDIRFSKVANAVISADTITGQSINDLWLIRDVGKKAGLFEDDSFKRRVKDHKCLQESMHRVSHCMRNKDKVGLRNAYYSMMYFIVVGYSHLIEEAKALK